ncbi:MAG TPA: hypothetical protein VGG61_10470 [Gemmataceae bacterium]|jgi:hypothetical protein
MIRWSFIAKSANATRWLLAAALAVGILRCTAASAQISSPAPLPKAVTTPYMDPLPSLDGKAPAAAEPSGILQTGCSSCGSHLAAPSGDLGECMGGCGACCVPGHPCCPPCNADSCIGRFFCGVYECICCPDPCYEPQWIAGANAAFFVDGARPMTQMRIRWDSGQNLQFPDRAEYFWARADGHGKGPKFPINGFKGETGLDYNQLSLYTEAASGNFSAFTILPYLSIDPEQAPHAAGFGDVVVGTKSMLMDCELLQLTFGFNTYIPSGNFLKGLGTAHVSLEPQFLLAVRLAQDTYFQGQLAEWIPLGGDNDYQGAILHYHFSLNQVLWRPIADVQIIGTAEFNGYSFQDGAFTDPIQGAFQKASGETYISIGPGLRFVICDKVDFGVGTAFNVTDHHFAEQLYRTELRWRF